MIELRKNDETVPICPHCTEPVQELNFQELKTLLGRRFIYFCSKCKKVLGVSHRKGFFMG